MMSYQSNIITKEELHRTCVERGWNIEGSAGAWREECRERDRLVIQERELM